MKTQLTDVRGVGPGTARALEAMGIRTVAELAKASAKTVAAAQRFGEARAGEVIATAGAMLAGAPKPATSKVAPPAMNAAAPLQNEAVDDAAPSQGDDRAAKKLEAKEEKKRKKKSKKQKKKDKKKKSKKKNKKK